MSKGKHRRDPGVITPTCPRCDSLPAVVREDGRRCLCANLSCGVIWWDPRLPPDQPVQEMTL